MSIRTHLCPNSNESERLAELRHLKILDTAAEDRFDRITSMAVEWLQVPVSLISFVDENRVWLKSSRGVNISELDRQEVAGLCPSAIDSEGIYCVENALEDPRTSTHKLVTGPFGLRFYAAYPLRSVNGYGLGTLNVIDFKPRVLTKTEEHLLTALALTVSEELELRLALGKEQEASKELRRVSAILKTEQDRTRLALSTGRVAIVEWCDGRGLAHASDLFPSLIGKPHASILDPTLFDQFLDRVHPEDGENLRLQLRAGNEKNAYQLRIRVIWDDRSVHWLEINGVTLVQDDCRRVVLKMRDIDKVVAQEQDSLKEARYRTLSLLASGVAHDLNNYMGALRLNLALFKDDAVTDMEQRDALENCEQILTSARTLTRQLVNFTLNAGPVLRPVDLKQLLQEKIGTILRHRLPLVFDFCPDPLWAEVDAEQMTQVFHNLLVNARDASPPGSPITIKGSLDSNSSGSPHVCIQITDKGLGITPEIQAKIFEPYFTTKAQGLGLGLATSLQIIHSHGGTLTCKSKPALGTTFSVCLASVKPLHREKTVSPAPLPIKKASGRVLVMDDHPDLSRALGRLLKVLGYEAILTSSGEQCVETFRTERGAGRAIHAVITDLTVAHGISGLETLVEIRKIDPHAVVIVSSGFTSSEPMLNYAELGFQGALPKPYDAKAMSNLLRQLIPASGG